jgi:hypothetical protein
MTTGLRGVISGKTVLLSNESGLPDGQEVTVSLQPVKQPLPPGEGVRRSAGAWADDADDLAEFLTWSRQQRKANRPEIDA